MISYPFYGEFVFRVHDKHYRRSVMGSFQSFLKWIMNERSLLLSLSQKNGHYLTYLNIVESIPHPQLSVSNALLPVQGMRNE